MDAMVVVEHASEIRVRTRVEGMLGFMGHDLELAFPIRDGAVQAAGWSDGPSSVLGVSGELNLSLVDFRIEGVVRKGAVHRNVLSSSDLREIERRTRELAQTAGPLVVSGEQLELVPDRHNQGCWSGARCHLRIGAKGSRFERDFRVAGELGPDRTLRLSGSGTASLRALGLPDVYAPLNAFKVADEVEVAAQLVLRPPA